MSNNNSAISYSYLSSTGSSEKDNSLPMSFLMLPLGSLIESYILSWHSQNVGTHCQPKHLSGIASKMYICASTEVADVLQLHDYLMVGRNTMLFSYPFDEL